MKKASLTIELSLLMPGILAIFIFIIFSAYYLHDRCVIERAAYAAIKECQDRKLYHDGVVFKNDGRGLNDDMERCSEVFNNITSQELLGRWNITLSTSNDADEYCIYVTGRMNCMQGFISKYLSNIVFSIEINESVYKMTGPDYMRGYIEY